MSCQLSRYPLLAQETTELHLTGAWTVQQGSVTSSCPVGAEVRPLSCVYVRHSRATPAHGETPMAPLQQSIHKCQIASFLHIWHQGMRRFGTLVCHQPGWNLQCKHLLQWEQHGFFAAFGRAQLSHLWLYVLLFCASLHRLFSIGLCWQKQKCIHFTATSQEKACPKHHHF